MLLRPNELAARYVDLWNETDPALRRAGIEQLYAPDIVYTFYRRDPIVGRAAIEAQMAYAHELYDPLGYVFRGSHNATGHHNLIRLNWVMVSAADGEMEMSGQDVLVLDERGLIRADYQFHDVKPTSFVYNDGYEQHGVATHHGRPERVHP